VREEKAPTEAVCQRLLKQALNLCADVMHGRIGHDDSDSDDSDGSSVASGADRRRAPRRTDTIAATSAQTRAAAPVLVSVESPLLGAGTVEMTCPASSTVASVKALVKERISDAALGYIADSVFVVVRPAVAPRRYTVAEIHRGTHAARDAPDDVWHRFVSALLQIRHVIGGVRIHCYIRQHVDDTGPRVEHGVVAGGGRGAGAGRGAGRGTEKAANLKPSLLLRCPSSWSAAEVRDRIVRRFTGFERREGVTAENLRATEIHVLERECPALPTVAGRTVYVVKLSSAMGPSKGHVITGMKSPWDADVQVVQAHLGDHEGGVAVALTSTHGPGRGEPRGRGRGRGVVSTHGGHRPGHPSAASKLRVVVCGLGEDRAAVDAIVLKFHQLLSTFTTRTVRVSPVVWKDVSTRHVSKQFHVGVDRNPAGDVVLLSGTRSAVQLAEDFLKVRPLLHASACCVCRYVT
jgi:hypothetical protein